MTQEWFESADLEKKSAQTKSEIQPDQPETSETVETEPQASQETPVSPKESERHEEEDPETIEETQSEEQGEGKAEEERNQENSVKEKSILTLLSMAIFALGNLFVISKPSKASSLDPFYRFLLAVLLDGAILLPFFIAELALTVDYLRILTFF